MYANINRQMAKQVNTTLWKSCREQQNSQTPEVNSHQDLYIHCSMNKFYVLYTSSMKFSKETEKKSKLPNLLHCKTGILLPHIN